MTNIVILGAGNVGYHLAEVCIKSPDIALIQLYNRTLDSIRHLEKGTAITDQLYTLKKADIYIICVPDEAIDTVSKAIPYTDALVVHTSGSTSLEALNSHKHYGVFYPLQSFSKNRSIDFTSIPICIEAKHTNNLHLLEKIALQISTRVIYMDTIQRGEIHKAAVFVNNFVNHMYYIGETICEENNISSTILHPIIEETSKKVMDLPAFEAQTGPAKRGDKKTIQNHLKNLNGITKEIYKLLSHSIANLYGKKL